MKVRYACDIGAWTRKAGDNPQAYRIRIRDEDDWYRVACLFAA